MVCVCVCVVSRLLRCVCACAVACDIDDVSETASPDTQPDRVPRWPVRPVDSRPCVSNDHTAFHC